MKKYLLILVTLMTVFVGVWGQTLGDYRSRYSGARDWNTAANWQTYNGSAWVTAAAAPNAASANVITIRTGATMRVNANIQADQLAVQTNAVLQVNSSRTLTILNGSGTDLSVVGQAHLLGNITVNAGATVTVNGTIDFTASSIIGGAGSFSLLTGATLSTRNVNGISASGASGSVQTATRSFSMGADYMYQDAAQPSFTGTGLPSTVNRLIVNTGWGVSLTNSVTVTTELKFISGWVQLGDNQLTLALGASVSGDTWFLYDGTGTVSGLNKSMRVDVLTETPTSLISGITELYLLNNIILPNDIEVEYVDCDEYYLDLNGYKVTYVVKSIAFTGLCKLSEMFVDMTETTNSTTCGTSINRTWTTGGHVTDGTLTIEFSYPETETNAPQVKIWRRLVGDTGNWSYLGQYFTSGGAVRTVAISGVTDLMALDDTMYNWTITDIDQSLPVVLSSFTAQLLDNDMIRIFWVTQSESALSGFYILRNHTNEVNQSLRISPLVPATNLSQSSSYSYLDDYNLIPGFTYYYWLESVDLSGEIGLFGPVAIQYGTDPGDNPPTPTITQLMTPFPNPFNPSVSIPFDLSQDTPVTLSIVNLKGQVVRRLFDGDLLAGKHVITWDGLDDLGLRTGSGIFMVRMETPIYRSTKRLTLIK